MSRERVILSPHINAPAGHMAVYGQVDIHLDSFPYTGGTTTCDALWHGVPSVTLRGTRPSDNLGASVLTSAGYPQWIASGETDYVSIATRLASNVEALAQTRAQLRDQIKATPLCDGAAFAHAFEAACDELWLKHLANG